MTNRNQLIILKLLIDMDARGNKLSSCKIPDQYLKNKKVIKIVVITTVKRKKKNNIYKRVVITTLRK